MNSNPDHIIDTIENLKSSGDYDSALQKTLEWLQTYIDDYRLYEELADIYLFQENIEKAEEVISYARELHPESWTGIYLEGYILMQKWDFESAIKTLEQANKLFPNNAEILQNIGWANVMIGNMQKWIALLQRAHHIDPSNESIVQNLFTAKLLLEEKNSIPLQ